jgi:hypothetical protein
MIFEAAIAETIRRFAVASTSSRRSHELIVPNVAEWALACVATMLLEKAWALGSHNMVDVAQIVLFISAGTFLYGLVWYLFRDQITSRQ